MKSEISLKVQTTIDAPIHKVWEALISPKIIKKYFFGTEAVSDFKEGSALVFRGKWQGTEYEDKATILKVMKNRIFRFSYWSSMSGIEDKPENYVIVTYKITEIQDKVRVEVTQENIPDEAMKQHAEENWRMVLKDLKRLLEKSYVKNEVL
jgi:uncharacterized protein YndB with AHSA1/START domain